MDKDIPIKLAVEDVLSEIVLRVILRQSGRCYAVGACYGKRGAGYLKNKINGFNNAAKGCPYLVMTDLDFSECAPILVKEWLKRPKHANFIFRVAVREVESWLLAHREAFAHFIGIRKSLIPLRPDELNDPKKILIEFTSKSRKRRLREAIVPAAGSTAKIGPDYNGALSSFCQNNWDVKEAEKNSPSLKKTFAVIKSFQPVY